MTWVWCGETIPYCVVGFCYMLLEHKHIRYLSVCLLHLYNIMYYYHLINCCYYYALFIKYLFTNYNNIIIY